jgi:glycosyltransferase involved in cell wall biosynthesis
MRLLLLNQYGPGTGAPTGRILGELAAGLRGCGHEVILRTIDASYGGERRGRHRLLHEILAHARLAWQSLALQRIDVVISLTSPACLAVTAAVLARWHRAAHFHWAMDLYPELGVELKEIPAGAVSRLLGDLMGRAYRDAKRVVALDEDMRAYLLRRYRVEASVIEPFPPNVKWPEKTERLPGPKRWVYSGNLGRAHEIEALLKVQQLLESQGADAELVLRGQGAQWASSQQAAEALRLRCVRWETPVSEAELGASLRQADVLVVTRKPSLVGLLLPSKLLLAELSGRPILWVGDTESHTAWRLRKAGHGVFSGNEPEAIATWLNATFAKDEVRPSHDPATMRDHGVAAWSILLRDLP